MVSSVWKRLNWRLPPPANPFVLSSNKRICSELTFLAFGVIGRGFCGKIATGLRKTYGFLGGAGINLTLSDRFCVAKSNPFGIKNSTSGVLRGRQPLSSAGGKGGFRRSKRRDIAAS